jgi:hypothetical protein
MMRSKRELVSPAGLKAAAALRDVSEVRELDFHTVAMRYALERFLARVFAAGPEGRIHPGMMTLKGGLTMFFAEGVDPLAGRSTSDIDFHVVHDGANLDDFLDFLRTVLGGVPAGVDDGLRFDLATLVVKRVKDGNVPGGKVTVDCQLGKTPLQIRSDLAFDARPVHELAIESEFPGILSATGIGAFPIRRTPFAYTVADKLQAMVRHGAGNYRIRDYYDLYVILSRDQADLDQLPEAIRSTFDLYGSEIPESADDIAALTDAFAVAKSPRWEIERKSKNYGMEVPELIEVVRFIRDRVDPILRPGGPLPPF